MADKDKNIETVILLVLIGGISVLPAFFQGSVYPRSYLILNLVAAVILGIWTFFFFMQRDAIFYKSRIYAYIAGFVFLTLVGTSISIYSEASYIHFFKVANVAILFLVITAGAAAGMFEREDLDTLQFTILLGGFTIAVFSILAPITFRVGDPLREYPFPNGNNLAGYLSLCLPMGLALYFGSRKMEMKLTAVGVFATMMIASFMSLSRGGVISFAAAMCFFIYLYFFHIRENRRRFAMYILFPIAVALAFQFSDPDALVNKFQETTKAAEGEETSIAERLVLYRDTLDIIKEDPILGHGPGTFYYAYQRYRTPDLWGQPYYAHNDYLELLVDSGVVGFALVLAAVATWFVFFFRTMSVRRDSQKKLLASCFATGVVALLLHGFVDFNLRIPSTMILFSVVAALTLAYVALPSGAGRASPYPELIRIPITRTLRITVFVLVGAYIVFAFWFSISRFLANSHYQRGEEQLATGQLDRAFYSYTQAADWVPGNAEYHYKKGIAYFLNAAATGQSYNIAVREIKQAAALDPYDVRYIGDLAAVLDKQGAKNLFTPLADKALSLEPRNPYVHRTLALRFLESGDVDRGIAHLRMASSLKGSLIDDETIQLAWSYVPDTRRLMEGFSDSPAVLARFAGYAATRGEERIAVEAYTKALVADPEASGIYPKLAKLLVAQGRFDDARRIGMAMIEKWPDLADAYSVMAKTYLAADEPHRAEEFLVKAVELDPRAARNYPALVKLYTEAERTDRLIVFLKKVLADHPNECLGEANHYLSFAYDKMDEWLLAVKYAKEARDCDANEVRYSLQLADLYRSHEQYLYAAQAVERLTGRHGEDKRVLLKLATIYEQWDKDSKACKIYLQLEYNEPKNEAYRAKVDQLCR